MIELSTATTSDQGRFVPVEGTTARSTFESAHKLIEDAWRAGGDHIPCAVGPNRDLSESSAVYAESFTAMLVADLLIGQPEHRDLVREILRSLEEELGDGLLPDEDLADEGGAGDGMP